MTTRIAYAVKIDLMTYNRIKCHCLDNKISMQSYLEKALREIVEKDIVKKSAKI
jgi:hypothetical protein